MDELSGIERWLIVTTVIGSILWSCWQFIRPDIRGGNGDGEEET